MCESFLSKKFINPHNTLWFIVGRGQVEYPHFYLGIILSHYRFYVVLHGKRFQVRGTRPPATVSQSRSDLREVLVLFQVLVGQKSLKILVEHV